VNMFLHELRVYRKTLIIWIFVIVGIVLMYVSFYPAFTKNLAATKGLIGGLPPVAQIALGIQLETFSRVEFFFSFVFSIVLIFAGIQAMNLGLSLLSKEVRWKTVDFLFSRPVSRIQILNAKLLSVLTSIVITNIFVTLTAIIAVIGLVNSSYNLSAVVLISLSMFFIQLVFVSLGVFISIFINKIKMVVLLSVGIVISMFGLNMLDKVAGDSTIWFLIPFRYFDLTRIAMNGIYEPISIIWSLLVSAIMISISYFIYIKKDIHAV